MLSAADGDRALVARMLLIALLIWVQGLAPFVHAHAGSARTGGWHLHTGIDAAAQSSALHPSQPEVMPRTALQRAPEGPEARAVGVGTVLPQGRDAAADPVRHLAPGGPVHSPRPAMSKPVDDIQQPAGLISLRMPGLLLEDAAGLPPPGRAPPFPAE